MKSTKKKRSADATDIASDAPALTTFSSDLLTPEEERELLSSFWDCKNELVRTLMRHFPHLRASRPPFEPWPMAQFIREFCTEDSCDDHPAIRRLHDKYVHFKHRLASANIRLAAHVAKRFRHHALSYSDLLQEAVCGLMQAIDRFDVSHGTRLATYATWWIRQAITRSIADQARTIRIPVHMIETINKMNRISRQHLQEFGFEPDASVLAEKMEIPEDKIRKIMKIAKEPISMETPIGDDDDSHLGDFIEDSVNTAPIEAAMQAGLRDVVKDILDGLTPREAKVLRMRFGIEMTSDHTLEEVGKQFDVTRERIRQIEAKALRKLKHPSRSDKLRSFIDSI